MAVNYNRLWKLLIDKKMKKVELRDMAGISTQALADMGRDKPISMTAFLKICAFLDAQPSDIMEYVPDCFDNSIEASEIKEYKPDYIDSNNGEGVK